MKDVYPFRGVWRWLGMPALVFSVGWVDAVGGWVIEGDRDWRTLAWWISNDVAKSGGEALALAVGKNPWVAALAAIVIGGASLWTERAIFEITWGRYGIEWRQVVALSLSTLYTVIAAHVHLRARRRTWPCHVAAVALFPLASIGGYVTRSLPQGSGSDSLKLIRWGVEEGLLFWIAWAVALKLSERAAPAPTPPAPET